MVKNLYKKQISELSEIVKKKIQNKIEEMNKEYSDLSQSKNHASYIRAILDPYSTSDVPCELASGCIINTMTTPYEAPEKTIKKVSKLFNADIIVIIDYEKLYIKLAEEYKDTPNIKVIKLPRSSGVISSDEMHRNMLKNLSYKKYFNGRFGNLDTFEIGLNLNEYKLYAIEIVTIPLSALPMGAREDSQKVIIKLAEPDKLQLQNRIIGVLDLLDGDKLEAFEKDSNSGKPVWSSLISNQVCLSW